MDIGTGLKASGIDATRVAWDSRRASSRLSVRAGVVWDPAKVLLCIFLVVGVRLFGRSVGRSVGGFNCWCASSQSSGPLFTFFRFGIAGGAPGHRN
ncbi:hypothetical protein LX32DRAFT_646801 [Colletotrichum zoysiae]|uniref:Uncharacterized protein n=1 Tax=Colletotrichum zoysiae TaxID=1216348 RepID=A0AAD9H2T5_9PEZI|nr:hypothetical protein LX32DRAFT_646801 [Colletotrichum zoysiae]